MKYVKLYEEFVLQELEDEYNIELDLYDNGDYMTLSKLIVSPDDRKGGVGTEVMNKICQYADEIGRDIYLTPDASYGGTSKSRLEQFYKRFDFKKKPRSDYKNRETMVRYNEEVDRVDLKDEDERLINIRHFHGSVQDLDDWLRDKIGETNPYKDTIMVNGPHKGQKDKSLPYQDFQNGESDLIRNRYAR
jgi:GNAT superfamily N-acetyltransferase